MIRVLLVEDDPMVAELNRLYVDRVEGFRTVASVRSGPEALEVLQARKVDLILLDVFMPGPDGVELLAGIRGSDLDVDVIFVTAARDMKTISRALKLGAVDYLIKPFEFERMRQALEHYRETRRLMGEGGGQAVSQKDLDRVLHHQPVAAHTQDALPKGLDRTTLDRVWQAIQGREGNDPWFNCEEIALAVGISRVSVRKYMEFLCGLRTLRKEPGYGTVGRPVHRFAVQKAYLEELRRYLPG